MKCEICKVNRAIIHVTEIENGVVKEIHLCQECAEKNELSQSSQGFVKISFGSVPKELVKIKCNFCNFTLTDLTKKHLLGCENDY
ncbi:MAG: excinuclease, partial [Planctomycetota bacterium]